VRATSGEAGFVNLDAIGALLEQRKPGFSLPGALYNDPAMFEFDLAAIHNRHWIMAGFEAELPEPGCTLALTIGRSPVVLVRGRDDVVRGFFNSCRHRGAQICANGTGRRPRLVCPYHQWAYDLDGRLAHAPQMAAPFDPDQFGLRPVHVRAVAGTLYVCLAETPPAFDAFGEALETLLAPHDLRNGRVAHQSVLVERANWKLVMENARECYHCSAGHPELSVTFPVKRRSLTIEEQTRTIEGFRERMAARGLENGPEEGPWWQAARFSLNPGCVSFSLDGGRCVSRTMGPPEGRLGDGDVGTLRWAVDPHCFVHAVGDHVFMFSAMPTGPMETVVTSKWLVHKDAVEGVDYDLEALIAMWSRTNDQDLLLAENNQAGVSSVGYVPGPYCMPAEQFVLRFVNWYCDTAKSYVQEHRKRARHAA